jgi:hypothetical protein
MPSLKEAGLSIPLILKAVEESGLSVWIRESPSLFAYWFFLTCHAHGMAMTVGASVVIDFRILGIARDLPLAPLKGLYSTIWAGFWIQVASGILLLIAYPTKAAMNPDFYLKLILIGLAVTVMRMIHKRVFSDTSLDEPAMMSRGRTLAIWSLILWVGVVTAGRFLAYTYTKINYSG